jgi:ubiquinone/menaquinone biosynthesis C-methylase UbiE
VSTVRANSVTRRVLTGLPDSWRVWLARKTPRLPVGRPVSDTASAYDVAHFERFYARPDPWRIFGSENEVAKYALTAELCGDGPFKRALEIGCGEGVFTSQLAPRCRSLLAVDISSRAVERARERCADFPQVSCEARVLPAAYPDGPFDLVVASDVLYFWAPDDMHIAASRIEGTLEVGGRVVALHYTPPVNAVSNGDAVHDRLHEMLSLTHVHGETREIGSGRRYRVDVWDKCEPT